MIINKENITTYLRILKYSDSKLEIFKYILKRIVGINPFFNKDIFITKDDNIFNCGRIIENCKVICEIREEDMYFDINNGTFIDVGGHIGKHSIPIAKRGNIKVISIEPNENSFKLLNDNIILNDVEDIVTPINIALSDKEGIIEYFENEHHPATNSLVKTKDKIPKKIKCSTLDKLCSNVNDIKVVKIDVEGAELLVLKGAKETLLKHKPKIYFESWSEDGAENIEIYLKEFGYNKLTRLNDIDYLSEVVR